jgi:sugar phosphate isomerase/epimerase
MEIGCSTVLFRNYTLRQAFDAIRSIGFEYIETQAVGSWCPHINIEKDDPVKFAEMVKSYGFKKVTGLWMPNGAFISDEKSVESGICAIEWAVAAGIPVVNMGDGFKPSGMSDEDALKILGERLNSVLEAAEKHGVYLAMEPHGTFSLTSTGLDKILSLTNSPMLGINYDTANIHNAGEDEVFTLSQIADRVVHFHAKDLDKDKNCVALGTGEVKLDACINILKKSNYKGVVSLESEGEEKFDEIVELAKASYIYLNNLIFQ